MKITEHVYYLSGDFYGISGNSFGIYNEGRWILIDTGKPIEGHERILQTMRDYGLQAPITDVLLTHGHFDHAGDSGYFQRHGAEIYVGKKDGETHLKYGGMYPPGCIPEGATLTEQQVFEPLKADYSFEGRESVIINGICIDVFPAAGHTAGGVFYVAHVDSKSILFVGDHFTLEGPCCQTVSLGFMGSPDFSKEEYLKSLELFDLIDPDIILFGHRCFKLNKGGIDLKKEINKVLDCL